MPTPELAEEFLAALLDQLIAEADDEPVTESAEAPVPPVAQGLAYTCGPAALLAVCDRFGLTQSEESLASLMGTTEQAGTPPEAMLSGCQRVGLDAEARDGMTLDELDAEVSDGNPVVVCMQALDEPADEWQGGHWVCVVGFERGGRSATAEVG